MIINIITIVINLVFSPSSSPSSKHLSFTNLHIEMSIFRISCFMATTPTSNGSYDAAIVPVSCGQEREFLLLSILFFGFAPSIFVIRISVSPIKTLVTAGVK
jgi:hypothetical protein